MSRARGVAAIAAAAPVLLAMGTTAARAASPPARLAVCADAPSHEARWRAPLDRPVAMTAAELPLGRALERVQAASGVRLSYSPDLVPEARPVCVAGGVRPLGAVLVDLLQGTGVAPVVVADDRVVLAPSRSAAGAEAAEPAEPAAAPPERLERVLVTGTATGGPERRTPFAVATVDGVALRATGSTPLSSVLDATVPGVWVWSQSPVSALARFGSIRGASSFGVSTPKIYIDGVEVANPLLLTALDAEQIERIEVIRGPQGAALYGADAISGVVNIAMRHDGAASGASTVTAHAGAGSTQSDYASGGVLAQDYGATLRAGSAGRSASLGATLSTIGAFTPGAQARQLLATASARHVGEQLIVTGIARFEETRARTPVSPLLPASFGLPAASRDSTGQHVRQYTLGSTLTFQPSERATYALTAGVDGYRLSGVAGDPTPLPSLSDSALAAARGGADRLTLRASSTHRMGEAGPDASTWTVGVEHSTARERSAGLGGALARRIDDSTYAERAPAQATTAETVSWWSNTGLYAASQLALTRALSLTGGARLEHMSGPNTGSRLAVLPLVGGVWVGETDPLTLKLRAAFGRGIRPARTIARGASFTGGRGAGALESLAPEEQAGVEAGADLLWSRRLALHVTRFDQQASGLVQPVASIGAHMDGERSPVLYVLQNVGAIDNRGWELRATSSLGSLALAATASFVDSRVHRLATGYRGDLQEGDRMLEVPARTLGAEAAWTSGRWTLGGSAARASDWVNYDELSLARAIAADASGALVPVGQALRAYWQRYDGGTHVDLHATVALLARTALTVSGSNLLDRQVGEPDNITVVPGRALVLGLRTIF